MEQHLASRGLTYALDESRRTVLRVLFARYAGQLSNSIRLGQRAGHSCLEYDWRDQNGDESCRPRWTSRRPRLGQHRPQQPGGIGESPNQIDPDYHANVDNEFVVGLDRELAPNVALSVATPGARRPT